MPDPKTIANSRWEVSPRADSMRAEMVMFCAMLFAAALLVADVTTPKLFAYRLLGFTFLVPGGTLAFSMTFMATDVVCEITGRRRDANKIVFLALVLRVLAIFYFHLVVGNDTGRIPFFDLSPTWTEQSQQHLKFVLSGSIRSSAAGLLAATVAFVLDTFVFNRLRERYKNRNLYWMRNGICTSMSQIVNSSIFISIAFGGSLTLVQIMFATLGQILWKVFFAWADTPLAYFLRNYGQGRSEWYAFWKPQFYSG